MIVVICVYIYMYIFFSVQGGLELLPLVLLGCRAWADGDAPPPPPPPPPPPGPPRPPPPPPPGLGGRNLKPNSEALSLEAGTERMKALMSGTHGIPSGGGGCASHVPARCRGETKSRSKCQSAGTASLRALGDEMRGVAKATSKEL